MGQSSEKFISSWKTTERQATGKALSYLQKLMLKHNISHSFTCFFLPLQALEKVGLKWSMLATTSWESMYDTLCEYVDSQTKDGAEWDGECSTIMESWKPMKSF